MRVAEAVGRTLAGLGVGYTFGVTGSGNFHVTNALIAGGVPFTAARHENGAACMADAYSRASGKVSVLSVHQGCGLTNAMTGIGEAAKSRTPMRCSPVTHRRRGKRPISGSTRPQRCPRSGLRLRGSIRRRPLWRMPCGPSGWHAMSAGQ